MAITRSEFDELLDLLRAQDADRLESFGGYPAIVSTAVYGYFLVAYADENGKPVLDIYKYGELLNALREAKQLMEIDKHNSLKEAFSETIPEPR